MPAPTTEIFDTFSLKLKFENLIFLFFLIKSVDFPKSERLTVNVKSVFLPSKEIF